MATLPTKPATVVPTWSTDTNYTNGADVGLPTKVEPTTGEKAEGHFRGKRPPARKINWWKHWIGKWVAWAEESIDEVNDDLTVVTDTLLPAINGSLTSLDGRVDTLEEDSDQYSSTSSGITSDLTNLSAVVEVRLHAIRHMDTWIGSIYLVVTVSGSGIKSLKVSLPPATTLAAANKAVGAGAVGLDEPATLGGVVSTNQMLIQWSDASTTGDVTVRVPFTYYEG